VIQNDFAYRLPIFASSTTAAATATGTVDRLGYDYVRFAVLLPTSDSSTSDQPTVLKISECDTSNGTFTDVSGLIGGTNAANGFTIPLCKSAISNITAPYAVINCDCRGRNRFLKISISPATTQIITVLAELQRAEVTPATTDQALVVVNG
jgi:hypothetical protein